MISKARLLNKFKYVRLKYPIGVLSMKRVKVHEFSHSHTAQSP